MVTFPVIPTPPTVIPAKAGIYGVRSHSPSFGIPQPSFRRKPESRACGICTVIPAQAGIYGVRHIPRHSGASRNLWRAAHSPSFRRKPESMAYGHIMHRHSGASRNLWRAVTLTVIPAKAGIQGVWSHSPSFRQKPESRAYGHTHRHSGKSRNPRRVVTITVISAQAGIYACRLHYNSSRSRRRIPACAEMTVIGASQR